MVGKYVKEIEMIKTLIKPIVEEYYPSKANREIITLYDLITLGVLAHLHFNGIIKHAYAVMAILLIGLAPITMALGLYLLLHNPPIILEE